MSTHVRVLAFLNIALGSVGLCCAFVVLLISGSIGSILSWVDPDLAVPGALIGLIATAVIGILLVLSLPLVIGGVGLLNLRPWARVMMLILSALNLLHPPFGTALGIYGFWVLLKPETEMLFRSQVRAV
jgi:hypothetical protein